MSAKPTIGSIDAKIDTFMESQRVVNESISGAISELAKTASKSESMQVEMNGMDKRLTESLEYNRAMERRISLVETKSEVNETIANTQQDFKKMLSKAFLLISVAIIISLGSQVFMNKDNPEMQRAIIQLAEEAAKKGD